ncbi:RNA-directed DNA polymerase, eukaryota, reverse transcriptase zinc-binding domain protein [Tanacetum coccineum]
MGDSEWVEVNRKKRRSVFDRLHIPHGKASNADDMAMISLSVYVSNFPSHLTVRELRNICGKWGTLVDVFIANRKNKLGQMYAFCRYIKVLNSETLLDSMCKVRIGKLRLHANVASRFLGDNMVHAESEGTPSITLQQVHSNDFPLALLGRGSLLDDTDRCNRLSKRLCIKSSHSLLIFATIPVTINNVNYAIRVRELCSWTPTFLEENSENDDADSLDKYEGLEENLMENCHDANLMEENKAESVANCTQDKGVPITTVIDDFTQKKEHVFKKTEIALDCVVGNDAHQKPLDSDPFGLDSLIKQRCGKPSVVNRSESPEFPPGFSPNSKRISNDSNSSHKLQDDNSNIQSRFSMIERLEETIKVGLDLGLNMDG